VKIGMAQYSPCKPTNSWLVAGICRADLKEYGLTHRFNKRDMMASQLTMFDYKSDMTAEPIMPIIAPVIELISVPEQIKTSVPEIKTDVTVKRPTQPEGYVQFNMSKACKKCPVCGAPGPNMHGIGGASFQDERVQKFADDLDLREDLNGYSRLCEEIDGVMLKCHWSRYGTEKFGCCGTLIWHDFGGGELSSKWNYYYKVV
jgi:hypothetical protein